jgi:hypothetical protein
MKGITVISTENSLSVDFGDYSNQTLNGVKIPEKKTYQKKWVEIEVSGGVVYAQLFYYSLSFPVCFEGSAGLKIDSIDGTPPSSNSDLYDKLKTLIA